MQFGVCGKDDLADVAAGIGYAYVEPTVAGLLRPDEEPAAFRAGLEEYRAAGLPTYAVNCFVPARLNITGPAVDSGALRSYVKTVFERAQTAGVQIVVFGSGGARAVPDGFDHGSALRQVREFCEMCAPLALAHEVTVAVEPLSDCNILRTVQETADLVRWIDDPCVRLLVDSFHWGRVGDSAEAIMANGDLLAHAHVATVENRRAPGVEPYDFGPFFNALRKGGYDGGMSFEGRCEEPAAELPPALALLKELAS